jgi:hypothetical protein
VLRERCFVLAERWLQTVVPPSGHPGAGAPVISLGEPATKSARDGWTPNLSSASLYGSGLRLYVPAASAVATVSKWTPTRAAARCPSSSEQLVTTPIGTLSLNPLRTSGASGHGRSCSPIPRSRSAARVGGTPTSRAACATVLTNDSDWKADYNYRRRRSALGYQAPAVYAAARTHP